MVTWVERIPENTMFDLCSEVFREVLFPSVYSEARSEIKIHKEKYAKVVILYVSILPESLKKKHSKEAGKFYNSFEIKLLPVVATQEV